jgi:flagellar basal-body rod modification protein FlgD
VSDPVSAIAGATVTAPITETYARPPAEPSANELDKDAFLKLLVAQLKYQDPLQPTSNEEFIATTAQFSAVEKLNELAKQGASTALVAALTTAGSLIGRSVTANHEGVTFTATVERSRITAGEVILVTDRGDIRLGEIVGIGPPAPITAGQEPATEGATNDEQESQP